MTDNENTLNRKSAKDRPDKAGNPLDKQKKTTKKMKKIITTLALVLLTIGAFAQGGKSLYAKYSDYDDVEAVYISPAMFRMIGRLPALNVQAGDGGQVDLSPIVQSLTGFYMISTSNPAIRESLAGDLAGFSDKSIELLMEVKDHGERMRIFTTGDNRYVTSLILISIGPDEVSYIGFDGKIRRSDLDALFAAN